MSFTVTYSNASRIDLRNSNITLNTSGPSCDISVSGTGASTRTVTLSNFSGNGELGISIAPSTAFDEAGNPAPAAGPSATFLVDTQAPAFSSVSITSDSGGNYARNGSMITLAFTVLESGSGLSGPPLVRIGGQSAQVQVSGTLPNYTASLLLSGTSVLEGNLSYSIEASDRAGNTASTGTLSSSIVYDRSPPSITIDAITSSRGGHYAANGDTVTVAFSVNDPGPSGHAAPQATIGGQSATVGGSYPNYSASIQLSGTTLPEGPLSYSITAQDNAGNTSSSSGNTGITYDRTGPQISVFSLATPTPTNSTAARVNVAATDSYCTVASYTIITGSSVSIGGSRSDAGAIDITLTPEEGGKSITLTVADALGNTTTQTLSNAVVLDLTGPVIDSFTLPLAVNTRSMSAGIGTSIVAHDARSSVASYTIAGEGVQTPVSAASGTIYFTLTEQENENKSVELCVYDAAGNHTTVARSVFYDRLPPVISDVTASTSGNPGWIRVGQILTIRFNVSGTGSAIAGLPTATIAGHSVTSSYVSGSEYRASYTMNGTEAEGDVYYTINAVDAAGNSVTSASANSNINFDKTAPSFTISQPSHTLVRAGESVDFNVVYTDASATISLGLQDISLTRTGSATGTIEFTTSGPSVRLITISSISGNGSLGIHIASGTATDPAGNSAAAQSSASFIVDSTPPEISLSPSAPTADYYSPSQTRLRFSFTESVGVAELRYWIGSQAEPSSGFIDYPLNGIQSGSVDIYVNVATTDSAFSFRLIDSAGNKGTAYGFEYNGSAWVFNSTPRSLNLSGRTRALVIPMSSQ